MRRFLYRSLQRAFEGGVKRRPTFRHFRDLRASQWLSPDALRTIQFAALSSLLHHAKSRCSFYTDTWHVAGLDPADLRSLDDLRQWPILTRTAIREHRARLRAAGPELRLIAKTTGGSTGAPLAFDLDEGSYSRRMAATFRGYDWAGAGPGAKTWYLWGAAPSIGTRASAYERLYRRRTVNCFAMSEAAVADMVNSLNEYQPDVIVAYTSAIDALAQSVLERRLRVRPPRAIIVGAEKLYPHQRARITSALGAPIFETYGSREFMLMACECERHDGLHLTAEHLITEIVDEDGCPVPAGVEGRVVITDLYNYGMPFIRYANGDRAIAATTPCACGRGLPRLTQVAGRVLDVIRTPDGRIVPGEFFVHLLKDFEPVRRFQIEQTAADRVRVRLVLAGEPTDQLFADIERTLRTSVGRATTMTIERVEEIQRSAAGKLHVVINRCA